MFKRFIIFIFLFLGHNAFGMEVEDVQPYKPSLTNQYPRTFNLLTSSAMGLSSFLAAYCGQDYISRICPESISPSKIPFLIGAAGLLGTYMWKSTRPPHLLDTILCNPLKALNYIYKIHGQFCSEGKKSGLDTHPDEEKFDALLQKFEKKCPLLFLGECTKESWGACLLSRTYQQRYRNEFEKKVTNALIKKSNLHTDRAIQYVSFASGGGFQDLVILAKTLAQKPNAKIIIHLIDLKHTIYKAACDLLNDDQEIQKDKLFDYNSISENFIVNARQRGNMKGSDEEIYNFLKDTCSEIREKNIQFISWLQKMFPKAHLSLYIHDNVKNYLIHRESHDLSLPDVIATADIQDEMSLMYNSTNHYILDLCLPLLQKDYEIKNYWLLKNNDQEKVKIVSYYLDEKKNSEKQTTEDETPMDVYIKSRNI